MSDKWKQFQEDFEDREKPCINIHCKWHDKTGEFEQNCRGDLWADPVIAWCDKYIPEPTCSNCRQLEEKLEVAVEGFENIKKIDKKEMFPQVKSAIMLETAKECLKKIGEQNEG